MKRDYVKPMTKGNFFRYYNKLAGCHSYLIFFEYKKMIYMAKCDRIAQKWCYESRESYRYNKNGERKGGEQKWAMRLSQKHKEELIRKGAVVVFTAKELETMPASNKGRRCEWWLHQEYNLGEYHEDTDRFDKCGDVEIDGIQYQVKFENASLTNVRAIRRAQDSARAKKKGE